MNGKIFVVETVSIFKHTYYISAEEASHAEDEVVCNLDNCEFIEGSQKHITETIVETKEVSEEEFIRVFDKENDYLSSWDKEKKFKMINVIDYNK